VVMKVFARPGPLSSGPDFDPQDYSHDAPPYMQCWVERCSLITSGPVY